jgi:hypothetical protein
MHENIYYGLNTIIHNRRNFGGIPGGAKKSTTVWIAAKSKLKLQWH